MGTHFSAHFEGLYHSHSETAQKLRVSFWRLAWVLPKSCVVHKQHIFNAAIQCSSQTDHRLVVF